VNGNHKSTSVDEIKSIEGLLTVLVFVGRIFKSVCLSVCSSVCPQHNSETNDPKVFKLGIGNGQGIYWK